MQTITCEDFSQFIEACAELTRQGIAFRATGANLVITITGF